MSATSAAENHASSYVLQPATSSIKNSRPSVQINLPSIHVDKDANLAEQVAQSFNNPVKDQVLVGVSAENPSFEFDNKYEFRSIQGGSYNQEGLYTYFVPAGTTIPHVYSTENPNIFVNRRTDDNQNCCC